MTILKGNYLAISMIDCQLTETEEDHKDTLSLMDYVKYEYGYMFKYSERPNTPHTYGRRYS